jgi:hypothetical protein
MGTTVDDLIDLKDMAVSACYGAVAAWERNDLLAIQQAADVCAEAKARAELYDAADEDELAVSIEDHERLESVCEVAECAHRDPDGKRDHKIRDHDEEQA